MHSKNGRYAFDFRSLRALPLTLFWLTATLTEPAMGQTGRIEGRAIDRYQRAVGKDRGIPGVAVVAIDAAGNHVDADGKITDQNGRYVISKIATGEMRIEFRHRGYLDHPTIRDKVKLGALVPAQVNAELYPRDPDDKYVTGLASLYIEVGQASTDRSTTYANQWLRLYKVNFPVPHKPALSRSLIERDDRIIAAVPQLRDYRDLDPKRLADAHQRVVRAFQDGSLDSLANAASLRDLPPTVFADLVTEAAMRADMTDDNRKSLIGKLEGSFGPERIRSSHQLLVLRMNEIPEKELDFKEFANPK